MATEKQAEANRLNAQKSTGPKTPEGKAAVRENSLRHGMRAQLTVLRREDPDTFHQLCGELEAEWQPQTPTELALLEKIAIAQWKLVRMERREAIICDVFPVTEQDAKLEPVARFQERLERGFFRSLRELEKLQKIRRQTAPGPAKEAPTVPTPEPQPLQPPSDAPNLAYVMSTQESNPNHRPTAPPANPDGPTATGYSAAPPSTADKA